MNCIRRYFMKYINNERASSLDWEVGIARNVMSVVGLWPGTHKLRFLLTLVAVVFFWMPCFLGIVFMDEKDDVALSIAVTVGASLTIVELWNLRMKSSLLSLALEKMSDNWTKICLESRAIQEQEVMHSFALQSHIASAIPILGSIVAYTIFALEPFFHLGSGMSKRAINARWFPYSMNETSVSVTTATVMTISVILTGFIICGGDLCLILLTFHCCGQLTVLRNTIRRYEGLVRHPIDSAASNLIVYSRISCPCLNCLINNHENIIEFVTIMDDYFKGIMFWRLVFAVTHFCASGAKILLAIRSLDLMRLVLDMWYFATVISSLFIYCWLGNLILTRGQEIGIAAYESNWIGQDPRTARSLMLIMLRAKRPLCLTAGPYFTMSLQFFKEFISLSASYLSVLIAIELS